MKLMVLTASVFPTEADARQKMWIFLKSAERAGVPSEDLHLYGIGTVFGGYRHMKLDRQLEYLKANAGDYTHTLFSDGWDAFFCAPLAEIVAKYEAMGSPRILVSAYTGLANVNDPDENYPNCFDQSVAYRYPHVGGYIAEIPAIIESFERMMQQPEQTGDDCFNWYTAWKEGWFRPVLDSNCEIFQVTDAGCWNTTKVGWNGYGRLTNTRTQTEPCILHLSGGYTDQVTGKDAAMIPWAKRLGVIE